MKIYDSKKIESLVSKYTLKYRRNANAIYMYPNRYLYSVCVRHNQRMIKKGKVITPDYDIKRKDVDTFAKDFPILNVVYKIIGSVIKFITYRKVSLRYKKVSGGTAVRLDKVKKEEGRERNKNAAKQIFQKLIEKEKDRKIILNKDFKEIGIKVDEDKGKFYCTVIFYG